MTPATAKLFQSLEAVDWFTSVGLATVDAGLAAPVHSWDEAIAHCTSEAWHGFRLDAMNHLSASVAEASGIQHQRWNDINAEMQAWVSELLARKVDPLIAAWALPSPAEFRVSLLWDVSMAAMECEYADLLVPLGIFGLLTDIYRLGHFPCGIEEATGRLFVY
jgi:hypothetical protein